MAGSGRDSLRDGRGATSTYSSTHIPHIFIPAAPLKLIRLENSSISSISFMDICQSCFFFINILQSLTCQCWNYIRPENWLFKSHVIMSVRKLRMEMVSSGMVSQHDLWDPELCLNIFFCEIDFWVLLQPLTAAIAPPMIQTDKHHTLVDSMKYVINALQICVQRHNNGRNM